MSNYPNDFDIIVNQAKALEKRVRVAIAGADVENILKGAFDAEADGFVFPILIGNRKKIVDMLEKLGLADRDYDLQPVNDDTNVVQYAIDMVVSGNADVLMRGNTQTRDFLLPIISKSNHLLEADLMTHVAMLKMPDYPKIMAISDCAIVVKPNMSEKKMIIKNMVKALSLIGVENPNIAVLSLVEKPAFHMIDTVEAQTLAREQAEDPFTTCNLVGPISYDLIISKEAARLKGYDCEYCGDFDGILAPDLLTGNLMIKILQRNDSANSFGVICGAKVPIAITSRSDSKEQAYLSLAACSVFAQTKKYYR